MQYTQDYDETMPNRWWNSGVGTPDQAGGYDANDHWYQTPAPLLVTYTNNRQIFICPSKGVGSPDPLNATDPITGATGQHQQSYGYNGLGVFNFDPTIGLADMKYPAQTIAITEKGGDPWFDDYFQLTSHPAYMWGVNNNGRFQTQRGKHTVFINSVYSDGHAKASRPSQLIWGNFYGVQARNETPFNRPCNGSSQCIDGDGDYAGPNQFWGGNGSKWSAPMATPAMDILQTN